MTYIISYAEQWVVNSHSGASVTFPVWVLGTIMLDGGPALYIDPISDGSSSAVYLDGQKITTQVDAADTRGFGTSHASVGAGLIRANCNFGCALFSNNSQILYTGKGTNDILVQETGKAYVVSDVTSDYIKVYLNGQQQTVTNFYHYSAGYGFSHTESFATNGDTIRIESGFGYAVILD